VFYVYTDIFELDIIVKAKLMFLGSPPHSKCSKLTMVWRNLYIMICTLCIEEKDAEILKA
jgi:hypothetical protein